MSQVDWSMTGTSPNCSISPTTSTPNTSTRCCFAPALSTRTRRSCRLPENTTSIPTHSPQGKITSVAGGTTPSPRDRHLVTRLVRQRAPNDATLTYGDGTPLMRPADHRGRTQRVGAQTMTSRDHQTGNATPSSDEARDGSAGRYRRRQRRGSENQNE